MTGKLTVADKTRRNDYQHAEGRQFGNLHERMRYLVDLAQHHHAVLPVVVWHAIYDLETEVSYHEPARPPYARRLVR